MNLAEYFRKFQIFIISNPKAELDLNDILSDSDLPPENQIEELISFLEGLESHEGLEIPKMDLEVKVFAKFIRDYYLTVL